MFTYSISASKQRKVTCVVYVKAAEQRNLKSYFHYWRSLSQVQMDIRKHCDLKLQIRSVKFVPFLCPRHKMARGHLVFALSVLPSFRPSVASKFVFSTPPTSLHGFEWNLVQMLHHKSRSACGEIIHVRQILAELWSLTLRIFTHFSLSSQLFLYPCMDLNETWQGCCTTSLEVHVGR